MGCLPLADLCLPLADLHHFRLTKGFPKTHSAIQPIGTPWHFASIIYYLNVCSNDETKGVF